MDIPEAFKLFTDGQHFRARVGGKVYEDLLIKSFNDGSGTAATVTLLLPTPIGEPNRFRTWPLDQVEVLA
jgi:hypothetical protein